MDRMKELFIRSVKSSCIVSIFYHIGLMLAGQTVTLRQAVIFTGMFILLYFFWLLLTDVRIKRRNDPRGRRK